MDRYHWLLLFHVAGAFLVLGGAVYGGILNLFALGRERPSEVVVLYRMVRIAVSSISIGMVLTLVFGLWLVADLDFAAQDAARTQLPCLANRRPDVYGGRP